MYRNKGGPMRIRKIILKATKPDRKDFVINIEDSYRNIKKSVAINRRQCNGARLGVKNSQLEKKVVTKFRKLIIQKNLYGVEINIQQDIENAINTYVFLEITDGYSNNIVSLSNFILMEKLNGNLHYSPGITTAHLMYEYELNSLGIWIQYNDEINIINSAKAIHLKVDNV